MSCQIFVANLMIFAQIHPKKLEGAPRFSQKKTIFASGFNTVCWQRHFETNMPIVIS